MRLSNKAQSLANAIGAALFGALFVVFIIQITARFLLDQPLAWTDELAVVLYIWMVLWCAAFVVQSREHVMFDLAYNAASPLLQRVMRMVGAIALAGLVGYGLAGNWDYIWFMRREKTPVLDISFLWVFLPFMFLLLSLVVRSVYQAWLDIAPSPQPSPTRGEGVNPNPPPTRGEGINPNPLSLDGRGVGERVK